MQTFLEYLTRSHGESGLARGFGIHAFIEAGPLVMVLEAALLLLCGLLIAGCFRYRRPALYRLYLGFSLVPLAWGIAIFTLRMLFIIDVLGRNDQHWLGGQLSLLPPLSEALSEITAVLLTCAILTILFLALSPVLRPRADRARHTGVGSRVTA